MKHELLEQMFDNGVRINLIIHIKTAAVDAEAPAPILAGFYEEDVWGAAGVEHLYEQWPELVEIIHTGVNNTSKTNAAVFVEQLMRYCPFEFMVQIQCQIIQYTHIDLQTGQKSGMAGWNYYRQEWCFANTMEEAAEFALTCAEKYRKQQEHLYFNPPPEIDIDDLPF